MILPPLHPDEQARLELLERCGLLDTPNDPDYDIITRLAADLTGMPIALVTLVDADRQWFKSRHGITARETPRDVAFCAHAIIGPEEVLTVEDARRDPRFADNPLLKDPGVISYAGIPLRVGSARLPVGTLCVIDREPRRLDPPVLAQLRLLARQVEQFINLRLLHSEVQQRLREVQQRENQLVTIFDVMSEGLVVYDNDGVVVNCNAAAEDILGLNRDELLGSDPDHPCWQCVREDGSPVLAADHPGKRAMQPGCATETAVLGFGAERKRWALVNARSFDCSDTASSGIVVTLTDIT
ncbi:MAG: GAF domain-containing protein, partial [Planctomycetota bacterium]